VKRLKAVHPIPLAPLKRERGDESDWDCSKLYKRHSKISFVPAAPLLMITQSLPSTAVAAPKQPPPQIQNPPFIEEGYAM